MTTPTTIHTDISSLAWRPRVTSRLQIWYSTTVVYDFYISTSYTVSYVKSTDAGATWAAGVVVLSPGSFIDCDIYYERWHDTANDPIVHVVGHDDAGSRGLYYNNIDLSTDTKQTTDGTLIAVGGAEPNGGPTAVGMSESGNIMLTFGALSVSPFRSCHLSTDGGANFTSVDHFDQSLRDNIAIWPDASSADTADMIAIYKDNSVDALKAIVWDDSAALWVNETNIDAAIGTGIKYMPFSTAYRRSDGVIMVVLASSADGGATTTLQTYTVLGVGAITAKTNVISATADVWNPAVTVLSNGNVRCAYSRAGQVYYKDSDDDMATWGAETAYSTSPAHVIEGIHADPAPNVALYMPAYLNSVSNPNGSNLIVEYPAVGGTPVVDPTQYRLMLATVADPDNPTLNITSQDFASMGGVLVRFERGKDAALFGNPARAGEGSVQLLNPGLANYVLDQPEENLAIRLNKKYDDGTDTWYHHFQGNISVPVATIRENTIDPMVSLRAIGSLAKLQGKTVSTALFENIGTGTAIGHVLDAAEFPAALRDIDAGDVTLPWFWANNEDAYALIQKLINAEGITAEMHEDGLGRLVFRDRTARYVESISTDIQQTISSSATSSPPRMQVFQYNTGSKGSVVNEAKATRIARVAGDAPSVVWTDNNGAGNYLLGPPGTGLDILILEAISDEPFQDAITPVQGTDYGVGFGSVTVTLQRTSGQRTQIAFQAGSGGALIGPASGNDGIQLRATKTIVGGTFTELSRIDADASIAKYGLRPWQGSMWADMDWADMRDNLDAIVTWMKEPRGFIRVGILAVEHTDTNEAVAKLDIGHRIRVIESALDLDCEAWIERIEGEILAPAASDDGDPTGYELYIYEGPIIAVAVGSGGSGVGEDNPYDGISNEDFIGPPSLGDQGLTTTKAIMAGAGV